MIGMTRMGHLAIAAIVIALVYFMIISSGFRRFVAIFLLLAVGSIGALIYSENQKVAVLNEKTKKKEDSERAAHAAERERRQQLAATSIKVSEVSLSDILIIAPKNSHLPFNHYEVSGRIRNNSSQGDLRSLTVKFTFFDCPTSQMQASCEIVGEQTKNFFLTESVPRQQTRGFSDKLDTWKLPRIKNLLWRHEVLSVRAAMGDLLEELAYQ